MPTPEEEAAAKAAAEKAEADAKAAADKATADAEAARKAEDEAKLGDPGKAALDAERKARREAEKAAKDAQKKLDELQAKDLTEKEQAEKRAADAEAKVEAATEKIRRANLIGALSDEGLTGARAKAAARLLDGVTYDDDTDEPTNLKDAIKAAKAEYGDEMFKPAARKASDIDSGGGGGGGGDKPDLTADELAMAKSFGMTPEEYAKYK